MDLSKLGYVRVGAAVPELQVANPRFNAEEIKKIIQEANQKQVKVLVFPELSLTGYTASDLFFQQALLNEAKTELGRLLDELCAIDMLIAIGMPLEVDNQLFNTAVLIHKGTILGVVPKTYIPNYNEFYEKRWFASSTSRTSDTVTLCGQTVPFSEHILFKEAHSSLTVGVEICEDLWVPIPPSAHHALHGANLLLNLSASNEIIGKSEYRRQLVQTQSAKCALGYVYASCGQHESTTDVVFSGHSLIAENGAILDEIRFPEHSTFIYQDIDLEKVMSDRRKFNTFMNAVEKRPYENVSFSFNHTEINDFTRFVDPLPFVPSKEEERSKRCKEIFTIQSIGLAERLYKIGGKKVVVGISGGLDSTLALLVAVRAFKDLNLPENQIIGITMPGFGTTGRTYQNALTLMKELGITTKEISIKDACLLHFKDIGHDPAIHNVTYENVQARERTQILMDIANKEGGLVVGTGDLSELALGWATYNGDHMSMYAVNTSIPKTLVRYLVQWYAETTDNEKIARALIDICDTPISPELLPPDKEGKIKQKTEDIVGSYELHDFFLYHMMRFGYRPTKIWVLAVYAFKEKFDKATILHWLKVFYRRFFTQQFKRSCLPDGPKVGSICLSPRGDWRMPSDASYHIWLWECEQIEKQLNL